MTTEPIPGFGSGIQTEPNGDIIFTPDFKWDSVNKILQLAGKIANQSFENISVATVAIAATDTLIPFTDDVTDSTWDITSGVITSKITVEGAKAEIEIHLTRTGGGPASILQLWREVSTDAGVTFAPVPNTLREITLDADGDGNFSFGASVNQPIPAGVQFKVLCKNIGSGTLSLTSPTGTNLDVEALTGFSHKLTIG